MTNPIHETVGETDIYLIDQIMKGRYQPEDTILDAGCGYGRNLYWFLKNGLNVYGVDQNATAITNLRSHLPAHLGKKFQQADLETLPFNNNYFDHIICSAVLHFAKNTTHFYQMVAESTRVLKPNGSLFIRMTSDIGIEGRSHPIADGVYQIPDGSTRFLLTRTLLAETLDKNKLSFLEPFKTVNVDDLRCMSTLVLTKEN
jgi:ubiquinone/menaquinone biosynthesis C-methylase UbiE